MLIAVCMKFLKLRRWSPYLPLHLRRASFERGRESGIGQTGSLPEDLHLHDVLGCERMMRSQSCDAPEWASQQVHLPNTLARVAQWSQQPQLVADYQHRFDRELAALLSSTSSFGMVSSVRRSSVSQRG